MRKKIPIILTLKSKQDNTAVHDHPQIQSKSELSLGYMKPCLNNGNNDNVFKD